MASSVNRVRELTLSYKRIRRSLPVPVNKCLSNPRSVAGIAGALLANSSVEKCLTLHVDHDHQLIGVHVVSVGTLDSALVHPREVFKAACLSNAAGIFFVHNHPGGDPTPSRDDRQVVLMLRRAGDLLGIELLDALIVTDPADGQNYYSFREAGVLS